MKGIIFKAITKTLILVGLLFLMLGGCAVESDMELAVKLMLIGGCFVVPEIAVHVVEWYMLDEK